MIPELASIDGRITPIAEASLPLPDDGLYRGDGVFEVIRLYGGRPFALGEHLDRIERSAAAIELPLDRTILQRELEALITSVEDADCVVRVVLTRGGRRLAVTETPPERGDAIRLATVTYAPSVILDGVKSISYAANMQATRIAHGRGAEEAVLIRPDGVVLEAPTSSIFWVSAEGTLRTPSLDCAILDSITRAPLVRELGVEEGQFRLVDLIQAREAFLASTTREVQAVAAIDGLAYEAPGPQTQAAQRVFAEILEGAFS